MIRAFVVSCVCAAALHAQTSGAAADSAAFRRVLDSARVLGLPTEPLRGLMEEGKQRGVSADRVLAAVRDYFGALQRARRAIGARATGAEIDAGASVLQSGADESAIAAIRAARPDGDITVALVVLGDLVARGVPAMRAEDAVVTLTRVGATDAALHDFRAGVQHDLDAGQGAESSLVKRTRETVSRFKPGGFAPAADDERDTRAGRGAVPDPGYQVVSTPVFQPLSQATSRALAFDPLVRSGAVGELRGTVAPWDRVRALRLQLSADGIVDQSLQSTRVGAEGLVTVGSTSPFRGAAAGVGLAAGSDAMLRAPIGYGALWWGGERGGVRLELRTARLAGNAAAAFTGAAATSDSAGMHPLASAATLRARTLASVSASDTAGTGTPVDSMLSGPLTDSSGAPSGLNTPGSISELRFAMSRRLSGFTVEGATGLRLLDLRPFDTWGALSVAAWIQPTIAIVGGWSIRRPVRGTALQGVTSASLGIRWQPGNPFSHAAPAPPPLDAAPRGVVQSRAGRTEFVVSVGHASMVEVAGDFTHWSPTEMQRADESHWRIALPRDRSLVRLRVRVDGGPWIVPAGVPRARDAFGEDVGAVFVGAPAQ